MVKKHIKKMEEFCHRHHIACKRLHHGTHMAYFGLVAVHGPYHMAAFVLLVLGLLFWLVKLEIE
jgi:hypothetical protein